MPVTTDLAPVDLAPEEVVARRIRRDWRNDIQVVGSGHEKGRAWVDIICRSPIAREQARLSLEAFVKNDRSDWRDAWSEIGDEGWLLRVWDPQSLPYEL
jgi:hypothetical protein